MLIPAHLQSGTTHVRALFETRQPFRVGQRVTLEGDDDRLWDVLEVQNPYSGCFVHRGWHNNI